jgi:hypothetical protein
LAQLKASQRLSRLSHLCLCYISLDYLLPCDVLCLTCPQGKGLCSLLNPQHQAGCMAHAWKNAGSVQIKLKTMVT